MTMRFREAGPPGAPVALLLHGWPNTSYLWAPVLPAVAAAGLHAVAPDFPGYGDSPLDGSTGTWEEHVEALGEFVEARGLAPVVLVVHDWGGLIGLRWACENPDAVRALSISNTGFFPDGRWHGLARTMRMQGAGEEFMESFTPEVFTATMRQASPRVSARALREYARAFEDPERRDAMLALYRSGDFAKLEPYDGCLADLGVPTQLLWSAADPFAPVAGAHRFAREIPHAELTVVEGAGHFIQEDAPERYTEELVRFLRTVAR